MAAKSNTDEEFSNGEEVAVEQEVEEAEDEEFEISEHENGDNEDSNGPVEFEENDEEMHQDCDGKDETKPKHKKTAESGSKNRSKCKLSRVSNFDFIFIPLQLLTKPTKRATSG